MGTWPKPSETVGQKALGNAFTDPNQFETALIIPSNLYVKYGPSVNEASSGTPFWNGINNIGSFIYLNNVADTWQTIIDITNGKGALYLLLIPQVTASLTYTIEFTVDSIIYEVTKYMGENNRRLIMGPIYPGEPARTTNAPDYSHPAYSLFGGYGDVGYNAQYPAIENPWRITNPYIMYSLGAPYLSFNENLKIRIKASQPFITTSDPGRRLGAVYTIK